MFSKEYSIEEKSMECKESNESMDEQSMSHYNSQFTRSITENDKKKSSRFIKRTSLKSATNDAPMQVRTRSKEKDLQEQTFSGLAMSKAFETAIPTHSNNPYWLQQYGGKLHQLILTSPSKNLKARLYQNKTQMSSTMDNQECQAAGESITHDRKDLCTLW